MKRLASVLITLIIGIAASAQQHSPLEDLKTVYKDNNVTFRKIDKHTWIGSGNALSSETMYIIEGKDRAVLIDAGTIIPGLDKIVKKITRKPVTLILTHVHPDHAGAAGCFEEVWINPADTVLIPEFMPDYKGEIKYLENRQLIELGAGLSKPASPRDIRPARPLSSKSAPTPGTAETHSATETFWYSMT